MYLDQGRGLKSDNWANIQRIHLSSLGKKIWMEKKIQKNMDGSLFLWRGWYYPTLTPNTPPD